MTARGDDATTRGGGELVTETEARDDLVMAYHNRLAGAGDWSTEYKGGYTPGWGPHVDPADAAAQVVRDKFASRHGSIREAFLSADTNKNGYVDRTELESLLQLCNLAPDTAEAMLRRFDANGDEEWSYKEFVQALKRKDYNAYQRGSPSPVKRQVGEGAAPGVMPPRAASVIPEERAFNLFTGQSIHQRVSPAKEVGQRYPVANASGRRASQAATPAPIPGGGSAAGSTSRAHTGRDSVAARYNLT